MWHRLPEQQQRGVQLDNRVPKDAVKDRAAQDHEQAGGDPRSGPGPGLYPSDPIERRKGDNTPHAAHPRTDWDERVQPEREHETRGD